MLKDRFLARLVWLLIFLGCYWLLRMAWCMRKSKKKAHSR